MFKRILIPLDGSTLAERAIPHAEQFARIFGGSIVLLQVLDMMSHNDNPDPVNPLTWRIRKAEAEMYLQGVAAGIRAHLESPEEIPGAKVTEEDRVKYVIREGRTAENIIDFAHSDNIDLLVISSHGSGGLSRWGMSSTIQKVIDLIYLPLLIVRSYEEAEETSKRIHYQNILLPIDSSRRAECAFSAGIMLAQAESAMKPKLFLVSVICPPEIPIPAPYPVEIQQLSEQLLGVSRQAVGAYLNEIKNRLPVETESRVVESNNISAAIQELADQENIDLVVMSAHGYSGKLALPYGNVTRSTIEQGSKPVLVIQDVPLSQVRLTVAAVAAEKSGRR